MIGKCGIDSLELNAYINAKIELKKLTLNETKCKKIHIGKGNPFCPQLQAHNEDMANVVEETYLGDVVTETTETLNSGATSSLVSSQS